MNKRLPHIFMPELTYLDVKVYLHGLVGIRNMSPELLIKIFRDTNVLEHSLKFAGVLKTTGLLQL